MKQLAEDIAQAGVTLIEMLVVVTIIALFAALVAPRMFNRPIRRSVTRPRAQIDNFMTALGTYKLDTGTVSDHRTGPAGAARQAGQG